MAGRIRGITIELTGDTKGLVKSLNSAKSAVKGVQSQLKDVNKVLKLDPKNTELLTQKQNLLKKQVDETKNALETQKQALVDMQNAADSDKTVDAQNALQREIAETEAKLKEAEQELKSFGSVGAQQIAAAGEKMKEFGSKVADVGDTLTKRVTLPLVALGAVSVKGFADVDKTMQLTNATMGNTEEQAEALNQAMKDAAANSTFGMEDAAVATLNFARAGLNAEQSAAALAPAMNLAAGEGGDLDTVSNGLVATINGFHGSFDDAATYADVFANACNNSALDVDSLASSMSVAAPIFSAAGYTINDAALYMGTMANAGIDASTSANALKTGFARLVGGSKDVQKQLDELGVSVVNADGTMKDTVTIQRELHDAFSQLSEAEQIAAASTIFGKNQMSNWLALINTAPSEVERLNNQLQENGTTTEMASAMMSGFGGSLEKLKSSIDVAKTSLGEALAPIILEVADAIQRLVDWFNGLSPATQRVIAVIGIIVAAIGPLLSVGGRLIFGIGALMTYAPALSGAIGAIAGPIGIVIAAIAAAIAIGIALYENWDEIKEKAVEIWEKIRKFFEETLEGIKQKFFTVWNTIKTTVFNVVTGIWTTITTVWNGIRTTISTVMGAIWQKITTVWNSISSTVWSVVTGIWSTITTIWNGIGRTIGSVVQNIRTTVGGAFEAISRKVGSIFSGIWSTASRVWEGIKKAIISPIESARSTISGILQRIRGMFPLSVGKIFSNIKIPHIKVTPGSAPFGIGGFGTKPSISVDWYAKAMKNGMVLDGATIFGVNYNGQPMGGGEAGAEWIIGQNSILSMINGAVKSAFTSEAIYDAVYRGTSNARVEVYIDGKKVTGIVNGYNTSQQLNGLRAKGAF